MSKHSQLTIFAIAGIIILVLAGILFYIMSASTEIILEPQAEADEIKVYVEDCLKTVSEDAIGHVGVGGGYIETDADEAFASQFDPFNSGYLSMSEGAMMLPYWFYQDEMGIDKSLMPPLYKAEDDDLSVQSQLESYVKDNLALCLNDFKAFKEMNMRIEVPESPQIRFNFTDTAVVAEMYYPVEYIKNSTKKMHTDYMAVIPIRLKHIYGLAKEITEYEMENAFLEEKVGELINAYSYVDDEMLPPMYGGIKMTSCGDFEMWNKYDVESDFKEMMVANAPYIGIANTDRERLMIDKAAITDKDEQKIAQGVLDRLSVRVSENEYPSIRADLSYMYDFPLYLDFGSDMLMPRSHEVNMIFMNYCIFEYRFYYSIKTPMLVTLYDESSVVGNKGGYVFQFPLMIVIEDNFPRVSVTDLKQKLFEEEEKTYQCAYEQRLSGDVIVKATDDKGKPIEDAVVYFKCGPDYVYDYHQNGSLKNMTKFAEKCLIGKTDDKGIMAERFPPCIGGGVIELKHPGHLEKTEIIGDIRQDEDYIFNYTLDRVVDIEVVVDKYPVVPPAPEGVNGDVAATIAESDGEIVACHTDSALPLKPNENVIIRLTKLDEENGILPSNAFAFYTVNTASKIKLAPGRYLADILMIRNEDYEGEMTIRANSQSRTIDGGAFSSDKTIYYPDEDIVLPTIVSGGAYYEFTVSAEELYGADRVRFHVFDEGMPMFVENLGRTTNDREPCSELNMAKILPDLG